MDIDLLLTSEGDVGLVSDGKFGHPVAGIMLDIQTHMLTLEFSDMDSLDLNIPVGDEYIPSLIYAMALQVGVIQDGQIEDSSQVPLLLINDPVSRPGRERPVKRSKSVVAFERFIKACVAGQPIHRDDLGDEASAESVVAGMNKAVLMFAPHLARQKTLEAQPNHVPNFAPGMGMGGGSGSRSAPIRQRPQSTDDDNRE